MYHQLLSYKKEEKHLKCFWYIPSILPLIRISSSFYSKCFSEFISFNEMKLIFCCYNLFFKPLSLNFPLNFMLSLGQNIQMSRTLLYRLFTISYPSLSCNSATQGVYSKWYGTPKKRRPLFPLTTVPCQPAC